MRWVAMALIVGVAAAPDAAYAQELYQFKRSGFFIQVSVVRGDMSRYESNRVIMLASEGSGITFGADFEFHGDISGVWATDLDANGRPEAVIWIRTMGSGGYADLKFVDISPTGVALRDLPSLSEQQQRSYRGYDQFRIDGAYLIRSFPLFNDRDANCCPTGGRAEITYSYDGKELSAKGFTLG